MFHVKHSLVSAFGTCDDRGVKDFNAAAAVARARDLSLRRQALTLELETVKNELGFAMGQLHHHAERSWRDLGHEFNMSHTQARRMAESARNPTISQVPVMRLEEAVAALAGFGQITRMVQGFEEIDVLLASGINPVAFSFGTSIHVPHLLLQNAAGVWVGIEDCTCGYGGTGPHNTVDLLAELNVKGPLRDVVMGHRYIDLALVDGELQVQRDAEGKLQAAGPGALETQPRVDIPPPDTVIGDVVIARLQRGDWLTGTGHILYADQPTFQRRAELLGWAGAVLLSDTPPAWADGPLRARCYLDHATMERAGLLSDYSRGYNEGPRGLIIERGQLQLWCPVSPPLRAHELFNSETRTALQVLGFTPQEPAGYLERIVQKIAGLTPPPYIDLPEGGTLNYDPAVTGIQLRAAER